MKKTFFLLCALLLVLGTLLPIAGYRLTLAGFGPAHGASSAPLPGTAASEAAPDSAAVPPSDQDSESFLLADQSAGAVVSVPRRDYLIGAVAAEMPISWPDEALKAQAIAAHSYALYCRDHAAEPASGWLSVDPVRRQGYLTESLSDWTRQQFAEKNAIVVIGACGIAVRMIAPFVSDKLSDSPVVVADEAGTFVIPLLSGHMGGANELAEQIARQIGGIPVITTRWCGPAWPG